MYDKKASFEDNENEQFFDKLSLGSEHISLSSLAFLDISNIEDSCIDEFSEFWCSSVSYARSYLPNEKIPVSSSVTPIILNLSRVGLQLAIKRVWNGLDDPGPISSLLGLKSKSEKLPSIKSKFPNIQLPNYQNDLHFLEVVNSRFNAPPISIDELIRISLQFASMELNPPNCKASDMIKSLDIWNPEVAEEVSRDIIDFDNVDSLIIALHKLPEIDNPINYLMLRYLYENLFDCHLPSHFNAPDFYSRLLSQVFDSSDEIDVASLLPAFIYVSGQPVQIPVAINQVANSDLFTAALALSHLTASKPFKGFLPSPIPRNCMLIAIQKHNKPMLEKYISEMFQIGLHVISHFMDIDLTIYSLIHAALKGDVFAAKELLKYPKCISYLHPEKSRLHKLVYTLLSDKVDLPKTDSISIQMAAAILRIRQLKQNLPLPYVMDVLNTSNAKLLALSQKLCGNQSNKVQMLFGGFNGSHNIRVFSAKLKSPADFITTAADNSFESIALTIMTILPFVPKNIQQQDDSTCDILADFSLHYGLGEKLHSLIVNHFSDTFAKSRNERQIYHILSALENQSNHEETLNVLAQYIGNSHGVPILEAITSFFIRNDDSKGVALITHIFEPIIDQINISLKIDIFEHLIQNGIPSDTQKFAKSLLNSCDKSSRHSFFGILGRFAPIKSTNVLSVFESIPYNLDDIAIMVEALSSFSGELPKDFVVFLKKMTDELPFYKFIHQRNNIPDRSFSCIWDEDKPHSTTDNAIKDPWETPTSAPICISSNTNTSLKNLPMFSCNTCGVSNICLNCALSCHSGHSVSYSGVFADKITKCSCIDRPCCMSKHLPADSSVQIQKEYPYGVKYIPYDPGRSIEPAVSSSALVRLILSLSKSTLSKTESLPQPKRVSCAVKDLDLTKIKGQMIKSHFSFAPIDKNVSLAESQCISEAIIRSNENQNRLLKRLAVSPLRLSDVSGDFLIIAEGRKLKSFNAKEFVEISSIEIPAPALSIALYPHDNNIIAVATLKRVLIYTLSPTDGSFSLMNEIELMLDTLGPNIYVTSIHWIPIVPLHIAVVCNTFVKVYDVPTDCIAPISCFITSSSNDSFTSAVFVERKVDNESQCIGLLAISSGQIAIQNILSSTNGSQQLKIFSKMPGLPLQPIISYCEESDLLFITGPGATVKISRLEEIYGKKKPTLQVNVNQLPGELLFLETIPSNPAYHIFVHPNSGSLVSLEFTDDYVEIAPLCSEYPRQSVNALLENRMQILSTFSVNNNFYVIEKTGSVSLLKYGQIESDEEIEGDLNVPATFWTRTQISSNAMQMKIPEVTENCRLYSGDRVRFAANIKKVVEVSSMNSAQLIAGFSITASSIPKDTYVRCHGRSIPLTQHTSVPLRQNEVKSKVTHKIEFLCSEELVVDRIDVFVIDSTTFSKIPSTAHLNFDWKTNGTNLFDFMDDNRRFGNDLHTICSHCVLAIVGDDSIITLESIKQLIHLMYSVPELSNALRSAVCRISKDRPRFASIWAKELSEMIENGEIHESQWDYVWRDYQLMPKESQELLSKSIWAKAPQSKGIDPFVSAFL